MFSYVFGLLMATAPARGQIPLKVNVPPTLRLVLRRRVDFVGGRASIETRPDSDVEYCTLAAGDSPEARTRLEPGFVLRVEGAGVSHERELTFALNRDARGRARYYLWCLVFVDRPVVELGPLEDALGFEFYFR